MSYSVVADDIQARAAIVQGDVLNGRATISGSISGTAKGTLNGGLSASNKKLSGTIEEKVIKVSGAIIGTAIISK